MTVHCWGEDPRGRWTLIITDNGENNRKHYLEKLGKGDEEDVTRVFLDSTEKQRHQDYPAHISSRKTHSKDFVLKTMEDTEGTLFNGEVVKKVIHHKKEHHNHFKSRKTGTLRHHFVKKKISHSSHLKKHLKSKKRGKTLSRKYQEVLKSLKRKNTETIPHIRKEQRIKNSKSNDKTTKYLTSNTTANIEPTEPKINLRNDDNLRKHLLKLQTNNTGYKVNTSAEESLKTFSSSVMRNSSEDAEAFDLINKLITQIEGNPLVSKIAFEALKNPYIGRLFGIDSSLNVAPKDQKNVSSSKAAKPVKDLTSESRNAAKPVKDLTSESRTFGSTYETSGHYNEREKIFNRTVVENQNTQNETGDVKPLKQTTRAYSNGAKHFHFLKAFREATQGDYVSGESGDIVNSGSWDILGQNEIGNMEEYKPASEMQSLGCEKSKKCTNDQEKGADTSSLDEPILRELPEELQGEANSNDKNWKDTQSGDGDGDNFFENMKEFTDKTNDDSFPLFDVDVKSTVDNKSVKSLCRNFSRDGKNNSLLSSEVQCPKFLTIADEREKEDKSLAHYLAINKLKTGLVDNELDSREDFEYERSSALDDFIDDKNLDNNQESTDSKYHGKDLEVLQEALEEQLSRLSNDPNSTRSNAEILARVKDDINRGDIDDLELLESQITGEKTDFPRVVRSISLEGEQSYLDESDFDVTTPQTLYEEINGENEDLEPRGISHQMSEHKPQQAYHVNSDKYGKDNSGILESWTLILYGTK